MFVYLSWGASLLNFIFIFHSPIFHIFAQKIRLGFSLIAFVVELFYIYFALTSTKIDNIPTLRNNEKKILTSFVNAPPANSKPYFSFKLRWPIDQNTNLNILKKSFQRYIVAFRVFVFLGPRPSALGPRPNKFYRYSFME